LGITLRGSTTPGPLLEPHPLEAFRIPSERDPKRPVISDATVATLLGVADEVHPYLCTLIVLARTTGRRLSAILGLRWDDIDFPAGKIRWRAEHDKLRTTWLVPVAADTLAELVRFRALYLGVGEARVFPHRTRRQHQGGPVTRHVAAYWLRRAYDLSGARKPDGGHWHAFRRLWATERKGFLQSRTWPRLVGGRRSRRSSIAISSPMRTPSGLWWSFAA
jgi:integrase